MSMLVAVTGFGSVWRCRPPKGQNESLRPARNVYYNTTGVEIDGSIRQRPKITGYVRFHAGGGFDLGHLSRLIGRVFACAEPSVWRGDNKLLFEGIVATAEKPDAFLVVVRSELTGGILLGSDWRSEGTWLIAFSEGRGRQEAMFLMPSSGWICTERGTFVLRPEVRRPWRAQLVLNCSQQED